jgi:spore coat protein CotF
MTNMIQNMGGMGNMTEQERATNFLLNAKAAIENYVAASAENCIT